MTDSPVDPSKCPLCGRPNQCALAAGLDEECWCVQLRIDPLALALIPAEARGVACLCPACAAGETPAAAD